MKRCLYYFLPGGVPKLETTSPSLQTALSLHLRTATYLDLKGCMCFLSSSNMDRASIGVDQTHHSNGDYTVRDTVHKLTKNWRIIQNIFLLWLGFQLTENLCTAIYS
jgi:hypothetical protein